MGFADKNSLHIPFPAWAKDGNVDSGDRDFENWKELLRWADRLQFSSGGTPTFLVAAFNASDRSKENADYICTGLGDQAQINNAIDALPDGVGRVVLSEGTFYCSDSIVGKANVHLSGMGYATKVQIPNALNSNIDLVIVGGTGSNFWLTDMWLYGNSPNQTAGTMRGVNIVDIASVELRDIAASGWRTVGVRIASTAADDREPSIITCEISDNPATGLELVNVNNGKILGTEMRSNGGAGFKMTDCAAMQIFGNLIRDSGSHNCEFVGGTSHQIASNNIVGGGGHGLVLSTACSNCFVTGNRISSSTLACIRIITNCDNNVVIANSVMPGTSTQHGISVGSADCDRSVVVGNSLGPAALYTVAAYENLGTATVNRWPAHVTYGDNVAT